MQRRRGLAATVIGVISIVLAFSLIGNAVAAKKKTVKLSSQLSGQNEVPPADPDGTGEATFKLKKKKKQVCFDVSFQNIGDPFVAHIHPGKAGVNGPPLITLFEDTAFTSPQSDCVKAAKSDIKDIIKKPKSFYINIHNDEFPDGAIRGQLAKGSGGGGSTGGGGGTGGGDPY
jgi:hypothetical protein